jgi:hypothetical protein
LKIGDLKIDESQDETRTNPGKKCRKRKTLPLISRITLIRKGSEDRDIGEIGGSEKPKTCTNNVLKLTTSYNIIRRNK